MKATVQYGDFKGTAAADISDHINLDEFIASRGIDTNRYKAVGAEFYSAGNHFGGAIICIDNQLSTIEKKHIVSISFEDKLTMEDFLNLFKRFDVIITGKFDYVEELEIDENITFDDRIEQN